MSTSKHREVRGGQCNDSFLFLPQSVETIPVNVCLPLFLLYFFFFLQEKLKLEDEVDVMTVKWQDEMETRQKMADKLSHERHQNQKEKESTQEVGLISRRVQLKDCILMTIYI